MALELITGKAGVPHVSSEDVGAYNAEIVGRGVYILSGCAASIKDANTIHVAPGEVQAQGRHIRITGDGLDVTVGNGAAGVTRTDIIGIEYTRDSNGVEAIIGAAFPGVPSATNPAPPVLQGNILDNSSKAEIPLYSVTVAASGMSGLNFAGDLQRSPVHRLDEGPLPIEDGGTGGATARAAQYSINSDMIARSSALTDDAEVAVVRNEPSPTNGYFARAKASLLWSYIKGKADAVYAAVSHKHSAADVTSGTLSVARGGTGLSAAPSMLTNLGSTTAASPLAASPRPGVTGTLSVAHGGTGAATTDDVAQTLKVQTLGTYKLISDEKIDFNELTAPGCYQIRGYADHTINNAPPDYENLYRYGMLVEVSTDYSGNYPRQTVRSAISSIPNTQMRQYNNGVDSWLPWNQLDNEVVPISKGGTGSTTYRDALDSLHGLSFDNVAIPDIANMNINNLRTPGMYYTGSSTTYDKFSGWPAEANSKECRLIVLGSSGYCFQICIGASGKSWVRRYGNSTWSTWKAIDRQREYSTSGSWRYWTLETGMTICWGRFNDNDTAITTAAGNVYRSASISKSFPVTFSGAPTVAYTAFSGAMSAYQITSSTTQTVYRYMNYASSTPSTLSISIIAIGVVE